MLNIHSFLPKKRNKENQGQKNNNLLILSTTLIAVIIVVSSESAYSVGAYASEYGQEHTKEEEAAEVVQVPSKEYLKIAAEGFGEAPVMDLNQVTNMSAGDWADAVKEEIIRQEEERKKQEEQKVRLTIRAMEKQAEIDAKIKEVQLNAMIEAELERIAKEKERQERLERERREKEEARKKAELEKAEKERIVKEEAAKKAAAEAARYVIRVSEEDKNVLYRIVEAEATGQEVRGKMMVANVIINRVQSGTFPNTVTGVVFQKGQFSPIRDGRYYSVSVSQTTKEAVNRALAGEDNSNGALYFMARNRSESKNVRWFDNNLTWVCAYGGHEFYK